MSNNYDTQRPYLAAYIILRDQDKIALHLRKGTPWMNGHYGLPAGKIEKGETYRGATVREAKEELGISVRADDLKLVLTQHYTETEDEDDSWINLYFEVKQWQGEPSNIEPDRHGDLEWFDSNTLPDNIIPSVRSALNQILKGKNYDEFVFKGRSS